MASNRLSVRLDRNLGEGTVSFAALKDEPSETSRDSRTYTSFSGM